MQFKKLIPLALATVLAATASAGAAHQPQQAVSRETGSYTYEYQSGFRQCLSDKYCWLLCGQMPEQDQPEADQTPDVGLPEQTPDSTPQLPEDGGTDQTPDTAPEQTPEEDTGVTQGDYAAQVVALVNAERAKYGLSALQTDSRVQRAAQVRASETVQSFSHTRPNGSSFSSALTEAGVFYTRSGENIAYGQSTPQQVVQAWMNSSGHRANILNESFTTIGVGYTVSGGTAYWAQLFTA